MRRDTSASMAIDSLEPRRLLAFGDLDLTFSAGGYHVAEPPAVSVVQPHRAMITLADASIFSGGVDHLMVRRPDGSLDTAFDGDGIKNIRGTTVALAETPDGKLLQLRTDPLPSLGEGKVVLSRFNRDGTPDLTFGVNGSVINDTGLELPSFTFNLAVRADGSPLVVQALIFHRDFQLFPSTITRYTPAGALDATFGLDGRMTLDLPAPSGIADATGERVTDLALAPDGSILLAGQTIAWQYRRDPYLTDWQYFLQGFSAFAAKLSPTGQLDATFGGGGFVRTSHIGLPVSLTTPRLVRMDDGAVVLGCTINRRLSLIEFDATGATTNTLRTSGTLDLSDITSIQKLPGDRLLIFGGGRLLAAKRAAPGVFADTAVIDPRLPFPSDLADSAGTLRSTAVTAAGRILVGGDANVFSADGSATRYDLVRLDAGSPTDPRPDDLPNARSSSLAFDLQQNLHVVWSDVDDRTLKYKRRDITGRWSSPLTLDDTPFAGQYLSLTVDASGRALVAYFVGQTGDLRFLQQRFATAGSAWRGTAIDTKGSVGLYPSIRMGSDDQPWIAYYHRTLGDLRLANRDANGAWTIQTVDSVGDVGRDASLLANPDTGKWSIASTRADGAVRLAERPTKGKGAWILQTLATGGGASHVGLAYDLLPNQTAHDTVVAYYDAGPADVVLLRRAAGSSVFSSTRLASAGTQGQYAAIATGASYRDTRLFWYDRTRGALRAGWDKNWSSYPYTPFEDTTRTILGYGRYLSIASTSLPGRTFTLAYLDAPNGQLLVRTV